MDEPVCIKDENNNCKIHNEVFSGHVDRFDHTQELCDWYAWMFDSCKCGYSSPRS